VLAISGGFVVQISQIVVNTDRLQAEPELNHERRTNGPDGGESLSLGWSVATAVAAITAEAVAAMRIFERQEL